MKERLQQLLIHLGFTATRLADEIQVQRSGISHILSGRNQPSFDFITRVLTKFPQINARWLLLGEGNMIYSQKEEVNKESIPQQKIHLRLTDDKSEQVRNDPSGIYQVTNVNKLTKVILLTSDGFFEEYKPGKGH